MTTRPAQIMSPDINDAHRRAVAMVVADLRMNKSINEELFNTIVHYYGQGFVKIPDQVKKAMNSDDLTTKQDKRLTKRKPTASS